MLSNPMFLLILITALLIIPLIIDAKTKNKTKLFNVIFWTHMIVMLVIVLMVNIGIFPYLLGKTYSYQTAPAQIKSKIDIFVQEANKRNINLSKLDSLRILYVDSEISTALFSGVCDTKNHMIVLPVKNVADSTVFHELGHCLLGFYHFVDESDEHEIMFAYADDISASNITPEVWDSFFYQSPTTLQNDEQFKKMIYVFTKYPLVNLVMIIFSSLFIYIIAIKPNGREK